MSSIAVFLVLGGATAFAATKIGANQLKANSVKTGKIVKEAVTTAKIKNNAVNGAKVNESSLGTVPSAATANFALSAENATPRIYAKVIANSKGGGVDETVSSSNITDASVVAFVGSSVYCFEVGFTVKNVQTSVDWIGGGAGTAQPDLGQYDQCPAGSDFSVRTTNNAGTGVGTSDFFISVIG